jgi:DNA-3-methyladenine glycosylase II
MIWKLRSVPPHDFYLSLDINEYFDHEHQPELIFDQGFTRPIPVGDHDVVVTVHFNGDVEQPEFSVTTTESLSETEREAADRSLRRILGLDLDARPLYGQAGDDPVLGPMLKEYYGHKRVSRANFFEDATNRIIQTQISHKPTARKMVYNVREAYGARLMHNGQAIAAWPRPKDLIGADPVKMKQYGLSERKGEYLVGLAHEIVSGNIDIKQLEAMEPVDFYETVTNVRGIGPTTAQDLMHLQEPYGWLLPQQDRQGRGARLAALDHSQLRWRPESYFRG